MKAHRAASGAKGGSKSRRSASAAAAARRKSTPSSTAKGRPLNFTVTGGQVHDSQVVGEVLDTPRPPLAVTADKAYDSEKVRQHEGALPVIPSRSTATKRAYCPKRFYRRCHKIENHFCRIKTGDASLRATTNSPETSLPPQPSLVHSIGSSCESIP